MRKALQTKHTITFRGCSMACSGHHDAKATYMRHKGIVDGGLWVTGPACLHCLPLHLRVGCCRLPVVVLEAGPVLWRRMVQDSCHTQLHLEVQKVIPGVFEEQILFETEMESKVNDMLKKTTCSCKVVPTARVSYGTLNCCNITWFSFNICWITHQMSWSYMNPIQISHTHCPLASWCDKVINISRAHDQPCANLMQLFR